tara:strand:- start:698 stop:2269 length:1572 start_codon:yes stop_codon:yes gene_type:complete
MEQDAFLIQNLIDDKLNAEASKRPKAKGAGERKEEGQYQDSMGMRNEPADRQTEIQLDDKGRRFQVWNVGMTRNAKPENRRPEIVYLDPIPHVIKDQNIPLRGWYKSKFEDAGVRARPCYTDALLTQPYGGTCPVGCGFCYINNGTRGYRGAGLVVVDPTYADKVRKQLSKMRTATAFYMSSFTDPFCPLEPIYENTRKTAEVALEAGLPMFFLTRQIAPDWAYDYLKQNKYSYMQFSINTSNRDDWRRLSPMAPTLDTQLDQVAEMHKQGIYVSIQVNPICAGVTSNEDIVKLIYELAEKGADHLIFKFVEIVTPSRNAIVRNMRARFGGSKGEGGLDRGDLFDALFSEVIGGMYTIQETYRKAALDIFSVHCKKAGVTMALCYEYEYRRDAEGNIIDKTGVSMGGRYLTADQCHGHRVPMFGRNGPDEPWQEIEGCPPSGCLTCSDTHGGEDNVPCDNPVLATANALKPSHLHIPAQSPAAKGYKIPKYKAPERLQGALPIVEPGGGCGSGGCGEGGGGCD